MAEIKNRDELEAWLKDKPSAFVQVIAARTALRELPFIWSPKGRVDTVAVYRALLTYWAAHNYLTEDIATAGRSAVNSADYGPYATDSDYFAAYGAYGAYVDDGALSAAIWRNVEADAKWLEDHAAVAPAQAGQKLIATPLWPNVTPPEINDLWQDLKERLLSFNQDWDIWTDWYDLRLYGSTIAFSLLNIPYDDVTPAIAMENNPFWERDPAIVNAEIKARLLAGRPPVETAVSESGTNTKPKARAKSTPKTEVKAKTKIGKAVLTNQGQINLQSTAITILIAERLSVLQAQRPNSEEAIADRDNEITELEKWQVIVADVKTQTGGFGAGETKEAELETIVGILKAAIIEYIKKNGTEALGLTVKSSIISLATILAFFCGVPGLIGLTAISVMAGGKPVVDGLKAIKDIAKTVAGK